MIEALKEMVGIIRELPHIAVWILAGLLLYKITVIGSIYGVIRFAIEKAHSAWITPRVKEVMVKWRSVTLCNDAIDPLEKLLLRSRQLVEIQRAHTIYGNIDRGHYTTSDLIFESTIKWLEDAVEQKAKNEAELRAKKL